MDWQFLAVLVCFALSGFAALLYQTAWLREFAFVFGTAELAVATVLAAYMAGLAAGAAIAGKLGSRVRRPVFTYGVLELAIALCALAVPPAIRAATVVHVWAFGSGALPPDEGQLTSILFYAVCAFAILGIPTALMGVTLPLLARYAVRREDELGRRIGTLYAVNTAGAVAGTLAAAFVLLPTIGLRSTVFVGAATNGLIFVVAALLGRSAAPAVPATSRPQPARESGWILPLVAVSGVVSFSYEVLWTRLLGQVLGGSVYAFATMLASFLLGITLGSAVASRFATTRRRSAGGFAVAQLGAAALSLGAFGALDFVPGWARSIGASSHGSPLANASIAAAVLLPAALCFGATFPFAVRLLARDEAHAGRATARVYAWNTVGAVIGALSAGLILLPSLGFVATITAGAAASLALALAASLLIRPALKPAAAIAALGLAALLFVQPSPPWKILRTHPSSGQQTQGELTYFGVGRSATVMLLDNGSQWLLSTNGLSEAAIQRAGAPIHRSLTTRWLSVLPVLAHPEARSLLLIGLGGGLTLQAVPSSIEHIDVIELEQEVVNANLAVSGLRDSDPLSDPRVHLHVNDARGALMLADTRYDVIVSQPSHPWTAGASHLYTREFFELIRNHLSPEGVFSQWIGMRFVDEELLRSLIATLVDVFPNVRVYQPVQASVVFLASEAPLPVEARAKLALAAMPDEFARYGLRVLEDVAAGLVLDERRAREIATGGFVNTDHDNQLAIRSPRLRVGQALVRRGTGEFFRPFEPYPEQAGGLDQSYLVRRLFAASPPDRAAHVAAAILDPAVREASLGWLDLAGGRLRSARRHYQNALELDPSSTEARAGWLLLSKSRVYADEETPLLAQLDPLDEASAAVLAGWRAATAQDWEGLRALDERLAEIELRHPLFAEAARLRATWRLEGDPSRANEALEMLDSITAVRPSVVDLILRARAANRSQLPFAALSTLQEAVTMIRRPAEARLALAELAELPAGFQPEAVQRVRARLRRPRR